jgi:hypothetical protein
MLVCRINKQPLPLIIRLDVIIFVNYLTYYSWQYPVTVAARSKAWTAFARSNGGIVGSNPIQGMNVCFMCVYFVFVLFCV